MSSAGLFVTGLVISIPVAGGLYALIRAAIADGRENARTQAALRDVAQRAGAPGVD